MKTHIILLGVFVLAFGVANAQFDDTYNFWKAATNPDNSKEALLKKEGYKLLKIVAFEEDEEDGEQKKIGASTLQYDDKGKLVYYLTEKGKVQTYYKYEYDRRGKVLKFVYNKDKKEYSMELVPDRKKGYKKITITDPAWQWDTVKYVLASETDTASQYLSFYKNGLPEKNIKIKKHTGFSKTIYHFDSTLYKYDRFDNLAGYRHAVSDKTSGKLWDETAAYTYNAKKQLVSAVITKFVHTFSSTQAKMVTTHTLTYDETTGNLLTHSVKEVEYYYENGDLKFEEIFSDTTIAYGDKGLPISRAVNRTPGTPLLDAYTYSKKIE